MANLRDAMEWAKTNPDTDKAKQLYGFLVSGQADEQAKQEGIDLSKFRQPSATAEIEPIQEGETKQSFLERVRTKLTERQRKVREEILPAQGKDQTRLETAFQTVGEGAGFALDISGELISTAARAIGRQFDPNPEDPVVQKIKEWGNKAAEDFSKADIAEFLRQHEEAKKVSPEYARKARNVESILNIAGLAAEFETGAVLKKPLQKVTEAGFETAKDLSKIAAETGKEVISGLSPKNIVKNIRDRIVKWKYGENAEKAINALEESYTKNVTLPKNILRAEAEEGKNFARFMAEKPYLKIGVKNSKYDTFGVAQDLRKEAQTEAKALQTLLEEQKATFVSLDDIQKSAKDAVSKTTSGQEREAALRYIDNEFDALRGQYKTIEGEGGKMLINVADANKMKQDFWDRSPFNPTASRQDRLASSIDYKLGQSSKNAIENVLKDSDIDIRTLNQELGDYYHSIEVLERLHGGAAPRGRIGLEFARLGGAVVGSQGGIIGSLAGYMTADKIAEFMVDQSISQSLKRYAVQELMQQRPKIAEQVADILRKQGMEREARLLLPESKTIFAPEFKGGESGIPSASEREVFAKERQVIQATQEKERFVFDQVKEAQALKELKEMIIKSETRSQLEKLPLRFRTKETWLKFAEPNLMLKKKIENVGLTLEKLWDLTH